MEPAIKKAAIFLAAALIVVIGAILMISQTKKEEAANQLTMSEANAAEDKQDTESAEDSTQPIAQNTPNDEANASLADVTLEAQNDSQADDAQDEVMYEGALAGLSEEEIAKLALAEEQSEHRTEENGLETAID